MKIRSRTCSHFVYLAPVPQFISKMEITKDDGYEELLLLDLSCCELRTLNVPFLGVIHNFRPEILRKLVLYGNILKVLPSSISQFNNLIELNVSSNEISWISGEISQLRKLEVLEARNNCLTNLPKEIQFCDSLIMLNLSGNLFDDFPSQLFELPRLKELYLGGNKLSHVPPVIQKMKSLQILYLGGNEITEVSSQLKKLKHLQHLFLCDNKLQSIPSEFGQLKNLESLSLHKNQLKTLPAEILMLINLRELTLRDNPLVHTFIQKLEFSPPSLLELCGRSIKTKKIKYQQDGLPRSLLNYLDSARCCVNPKCDGVYFDSRVKCVKFVDFCGKFRLPLEQYLCSPNEGTYRDNNDSVDYKRLQKVLLPADVVSD